MAGRDPEASSDHAGTSYERHPARPLDEVRDGAPVDAGLTWMVIVVGSVGVIGTLLFWGYMLFWVLPSIW